MIARAKRMAPFVPRYLPAAKISQLRQPLLAAVNFGSDKTPRAAVNLSIPMTQLGEPVVEVWEARSEPVTGTHGEVRFAHDGQLFFGVFSSPEAEDIDGVTRGAYESALAAARAAGYQHVLRMWNHVGSINAENDGLERYRSFCKGRYEAFAGAGYELAADLPSASAVGMAGTGLVTYFIAGRAPGVQVENPRQVSAYRYPPEYGPRSPSFSRATVFNNLVYVAGTSSVVGHASVHVDDIRAQVEETLRNLELVMSASLPGATLQDAVAVKTYIRRDADFAEVARLLRPALPQTCELMFLEADICRSDLLVEVEAVASRAS